MIPALPPDWSAAIRHVEAAYPNEGCGVILEAGGRWRVRPMENAYDRHRARDPVQFPRTARTAYLFDPKEWLEVLEGADRAGERIACIFHSHADVGAYFSDEDQAMAAPEGQPLMPEAGYLVIAVDKGRATAAQLVWWGNGRFDQRAVEFVNP